VVMHVSEDLVSAVYQDLQKRLGAAKHESCQHLLSTTPSQTLDIASSCSLPVTTSLLPLEYSWLILRFLLVFLS